MLTPHPGAKLEVWGDPIAHSRSPQLHAAAYRVLGLDWTYGRRRVPEAAFTAELGGLTEHWRGLSLTMPLKGAAFAAARTRDRAAELTGAVNTLLLADGGPHGYNTDIGGLVRDLSDHGLVDVPRVRIIGAGATATSALVAVGDVGIRDVEVLARRPEAAARLAALGRSLDIRMTVAPFTDAVAPVDLTIATLPGDATVPRADALATSGGVLYDVVYGSWPTRLAVAWRGAGGRAVSGIGMLLHQALRQVRIFVTGDAEQALPGEAAVLAAMRDAAMGH